MNIPIDWAIPQMTAFMLVVARLSGLFLLAPVFSSPMIPGRVKTMALLVLAATMTPIVAGAEQASLPRDTVPLLMMIGKETIIGLALGFSVSIVFSAVQVAASFLDTSIGFSLANIVDPLNNSHSSVLGSFYTMIATLSFLAIDGHHFLLIGFRNSFKAIPLTMLPDFHAVYDNVFTIFAQLFAIAFQIAAPVLITLLVVDIVLGIVSRVVPQMNVFFVGIPLKIGVGMGAVVIALPAFVSFFEHRVSDIVTGATVLAGAAGT